MIAILSHLRSQRIAKQNRTEHSEAKQSTVVTSVDALLLRARRSASSSSDDRTRT